MENSTVPSKTEECKNKDAIEQSPAEETHCGQSYGPVSSGGTNEENGEEEPNPQVSDAEMKEGDHAKDTEEQKDVNKDIEKEILTEEEIKESESSKDADVEKEKGILKDEAGEHKEIDEKEENVLAEEEAMVKAEFDSLKEKRCEEEGKIKKEEKKKEHKKEKDSKQPARETPQKVTKTKEKGEEQTNKEPKDKQEKTKGKSGATPSSSGSRTSALYPSRSRGARPSARREAMAKFQQDQTPVVRNFKVQKTSVGLPDGASIKQKILHWCSNKTRNYEGVSIENFSSSWSDGLAFCALVHRFFPSAFDFSSLKASERERNFTLAFSTAESLAGCCPLLDVSDMLLMGKKPDPFSVFTYVQSLCQHLSKIEQGRKEREKAEEGKNQSEMEDKCHGEGQEANEEKEQEKRADEQEVEKEEGEGDLPGEVKSGPKEEGQKMEMDQNDNVVISEEANKT